MNAMHPAAALRTRSDRPIIDALQAYTSTFVLVGLSSLLGMWIAPRWGTAAVDMVYLPAVLAAAALWGLGPGVAAGIVSTLAYNFLFTEPVHTLRIDRATDVVTVLVLLVVALVTGRLAAGIRTQARIAEAHARRNALIAGFAGKLLSCTTEDRIASVTCEELRRLFDCNAVVVGGQPDLRIIAAAPQGNALTPSDLAAAALAIESGRPAGRATSQLQPAEWAFHPIRSAGIALATVGLARDDGMPPVEESRIPLLTNLLDQMALALERARLEGESRAFEATRERDRLRTVLVSSIGQDLGPSLTAMSAAVRELKRNGAADKQVVSAIGSEVAKVERYVSNLLDLGPEADQPLIEAAGARIDLFHRSVTRNGEEVHLTPKEYAVLAELAKHRGRVLTHAHLLRTVWGPAQERQIEYLRVAIRALRQKLEADPAHPSLIINEPAVGYRLLS